MISDSGLKMPTQRSPVVTYAIMSGLIAWALVTSLILRKTIEPNFFLPFLTVTLVSSWFFGRNAGLLVTALGTAVIDFFFIPPTYSFVIRNWSEASNLLTYVVTALLVTFLVDELRYSKVRLTAALTSMADAVFVTDRLGRVTFLNPVAEAMIGYLRKEARNQPLADVLVLRDEASGETVDVLLKKILGDGTPFQSNSHKVLTSRHGHTIFVEESAAPIRDQNGKITGSIFVLRDITARRQVQDQVSQSQKMAAVGRLAGGVAGDFNNLLTVITGYSEMLRSEMAAENPLRRFAEEIYSAAERAAGLTRQLLAFSRGQNAQARVMDPQPMIAGMETMLKRLMGDQITVVIMPSSGLGKIKADSAQLEQAIVNLAMNSRDAMPNGGRFVIEVMNTEVKEGQSNGCPGLEPGEYVMLAVSDTGHGMDAETRGHLFEPFFTTKNRGQGSGLGLSIVYGIVQQAKGHINFYSELNAGTIFELFFPRQKEGAGAVIPARPQRPRGTETILVADDEDGVRKLIHAVLATHGYTVVETRDGREALAAYEANPAVIDLVVTDVVMPNMTGIELGDKLAVVNPKLKVLYVSGYRDAHTGNAEQERERLFLQKPFTPAALLIRVREILDAR
jgi:two-component system cell cycle sensor histidine kinase/response regulator CckA